MFRFAFAVLACGMFSQSVESATVYRCSDASGGTVFSDTPCGEDAKAVATYGTNTKKATDPSWCMVGTAPESLVVECLDAWRPSLRDPRAAYASGGVLVTQAETGVSSVFVNGYAKNGFGGFNSMVMECDVSTGGGIDPAGTASWIKLFLAFSDLDVDRKPHDVKNCAE